MDIVVFKFPRLEDGIDKIEKTVIELESRRWAGGTLSHEELDWLDWANNVTLGVYNKHV